MVDRGDTDQKSLNLSSSTRRHFLRRSGLMTASASIAALLPSTEQGTASARASHGECLQLKSPLREVEGKVAFITGGAGSIGLGIVRAFVDVGMKVVIADRSQVHIDDAMTYLAQVKDRVHAIRLDVTDRPSMEKAAAETVRVFGKVHVLFNNVGIGTPLPLSKATYEDWDRYMAVNLTGAFNGVHAFLPHLLAHGEGGQIVCTSSMLGLVALDNWAIYSASKAALVALMEALRGELADSNIGVSVYCPGTVNSSRTHPQLKFSALAMDPLEAGRLVLRGIRRNDLYILTHPEWELGMRDRYEALLASLPTEASETPLVARRPNVTNPIFGAERDRQRCIQASEGKSTK